MLEDAKYCNVARGASGEPESQSEPEGLRRERKRPDRKHEEPFGGQEVSQKCVVNHFEGIDLKVAVGHPGALLALGPRSLFKPADAPVSPGA